MGAHQEPRGLIRGGQFTAHGDTLGIGLLDQVRRFAQIRIQCTGKETHYRSGAAGGVGLLATDGFEDAVPGVFFRPDHGQPARVGVKVVLHIVVLGVASTQVTHVIVFLRTSGARTVSVGAADEPHDKGVFAQLVRQQHAVLQYIADHVAAGKLFQRNRVGPLGAHLAVNRAQHIEVVGGNLLEITLLIHGVQAHAAQAVVATFRGALVLNQFHHRLEEQAIVQLLGRPGIIEHTPAGKVRVMGDRHHVAAVVQVGTALAQLPPQAGKTVVTRVVDCHRRFCHLRISKNHIAVHVVLVEGLGVLVGHKGGEFAGGAAIVVIFRRLSGELPGLGVGRVTI